MVDEAARLPELPVGLVDKVERFMLLVQQIQAVPPEDRQRMCDAGRRDPSPKVRLFFECLERELRKLGHLPAENA